MTINACERFSHPKRYLLALGIPAAVVALYCMGLAMQVAGWILVQTNGGDADPFPHFLPQHLSPLMWVWLSVFAAALVLLLRAKRGKTVCDARTNLNAQKPTGGDVQ